MSLSPKSLAAIQKAGQAAHSACQNTTANLQEQANSTIAGIAKQPFGQDSERAITQFKMLARLNQGLTSVEAQLRELYAIAVELSNPESEVVTALPFVGKYASADEAVEDVIAKPSKVGRRSQKILKRKKGSKVATSSGPVTANDATLLQYLQNILKPNEVTRLTGGAMASGSGLPLGSIGVSLKKILASGAVTSSARGQYQLGMALAAQASSSEKVVKPARKTKAGSTKKVKTSAVNQEMTADAQAVTA